MVDKIDLSSASRANLLSLQNTAQLIARTPRPVVLGTGRQGS